MKKILIAVLLALASVVALMVPSVRRYLKIERM
jgi:Family of unknown function (DUF6893)